jgi:competence protein ComEA
MRANIGERRRTGKVPCLLAGTALLLAASVGATARAPSTAAWQVSSPSLTEEEFARVGEETLFTVCSECHPVDEIVVTRRAPTDWGDVVKQMATKGAKATQQQFATIAGYLARFYGLVLVNSAKAADFCLVLGISQEQAEAIVTYRAQHGRFADFSALLNVPGIDTNKIGEDRSALRFD